MPNKVPSKGTALLMEISSVYTAFPQISSLNISGEKAETVDTTTLDGGAAKTKNNTGYVDNATISGECLYDPDDTVQIAFIAKVRGALTAPQVPATCCGDHSRLRLPGLLPDEVAFASAAVLRYLKGDSRAAAAGGMGARKEQFRAARQRCRVSGRHCL
jgi:hypothetical protein